MIYQTAGTAVIETTNEWKISTESKKKKKKLFFVGYFFHNS